MFKNGATSRSKCPVCGEKTVSLCELDGNCYTKCSSCDWKIIKYSGIGNKTLKEG